MTKNPSPESQPAVAVRSLRERGELQDIVELFGSVDENDDEGWHDLPLLVELARTYSLLGDEPRLEKFFVRCADLNPPRAALYHGQIGWHFHRKKRWARALTWYEKAIETFPSYHLALFRMGYCLERLHRPGAAAKALGMADEAYHSSSPEQRERARGIQVQTLFHLARNLSQTNRHEAGREALDRCADLDAHSLERVIRDEHWRSSYGNSYLREGKPQEALRWLEDALRLEPQSPVIWERLGRAYEQCDDPQKAEEALQKAVGLPRGAAFLVSLAAFYRRCGRLTDAAQALVRSSADHPRGEVRTRLELVQLQLQLSRPRAALEELEGLAAGRVPAGSTLACEIEGEIAEILVDHGHYQRALPYLAAARASESETAEQSRHLAELEAAMQDKTTNPERAVTNRPLPSDLEKILDQNQARLSGRIHNYFSKRGYGFIEANPGSGKLFFHISQCEFADGQEAQPGLRVSFVIGANKRNGREQAESVRVVESTP